jgi:hypothetical protein
MRASLTLLLVVLTFSAASRAQGWPTHRHDVARSGPTGERLTPPPQSRRLHRTARRPSPAWPPAAGYTHGGLNKGNSRQVPGQGKSATGPRPRSAEPKLSWRRAQTSIALLHRGRVVWQHVHDRKIGKPYMRIGLLDGTELTRPWPIPKGYPKSDHTWHRALWWSWKAIDGVNYWEENQQGTDPVKVEIAANKDGSAGIHATLAYHQPGKAPVVTEERRVDVSAPDKTGSYLITWQATFTAAGKKDVVFNRNSYGGLAIRLAAECCGDPARAKPAWTFLDSEKRRKCNGRAARWVAYFGTAPNGRAAGVAIFDHPDNPRHPSWWQTRDNYPYLNPSFTCKEDYRLPAGKSLTLKYGVLVHQGAATHETFNRAWKRFASSAERP